MSNIIQLHVPYHPRNRDNGIANLIANFSENRRSEDDVFWLKENAEILNILECTGTELSAGAFSTLEGFYQQIEKRLSFFPQYYRFFLSICLDLEDLAFGPQKGQQMVEWVHARGLVGAEMSDLQRAEARRLMLRRGLDPTAADAGLDDRLRDFVSRSETFAMPNKKAAYELTHTVFYLSEYGRKDPGLDQDCARSLDFAGTLAFLDQNADLLAEVCIAMRHAGLIPSAIWEEWLIAHAHCFATETDPSLPLNDDYHEYLVCNWLLAMAEPEGFMAKPFTPKRTTFHRPRAAGSALRMMSETMYQLDDARSDKWGRMRSMLETTMSADCHAVLTLAEEASADFEQFFAGFSRVGMS